MSKGRKLTNEQRTVYAKRAWTEGDASIAKEAEVEPSTVAEWRRKFAPQGNSGEAPSGGAAAAAVNAAATATIGYEGYKDARPPNKQAISYWKAERFIDKLDWAEATVGPLQRPDGTHLVAFTDSQASYDPRNDVGDLFHGLGTLAVYGEEADILGDDPEECANHDERIDWWAQKRNEDIAEALPWMMRNMRDEGLGELDEDWADESPSCAEMNETARIYHRRTGDYAFPLYQVGVSHGVRLEIENPDTEDDTPADGWGMTPVGYAFLTADEAEHTSSDTWEKAHSNMQYAIDVRNDYISGAAIEATVAVFNEDGDNSRPSEIIGSGMYRNSDLEDCMRDLVSEYLTVPVD